MCVYATWKPLRSVIALRIAAHFRHHHCQIAVFLEGVTHALFQQRGLRPMTPPFWHGGRTAEQSNSFMDREHAGGAQLAVKFGKKARARLTCRTNAPALLNKVGESGCS
jgi:hypothetical protein